MKHLENIDQAWSLIARGADELGVPLSNAQLDQLIAHLEAVLLTTRDLNLTTVTAPASAAAVHVLDSLSGFPLVQAAPPGAVVDIGSGAGFPGIPLGVSTGRRMVLLESSRKKAAFLEGVVEQLGLDAEVAAERAEDYARHAPAAGTVVVARAVAALPALVELARPLLAQGGVFLAYKGAPEPAELERADEAAAICGFVPGERIPVEVPQLGARRTLIAFRVASASRMLLPRRTGLAQKRPLA